jgi:hypothetical protein
VVLFSSCVTWSWASWRASRFGPIHCHVTPSILSCIVTEDEEANLCSSTQRIPILTKNAAIVLGADFILFHNSQTTALELTDKCQNTLRCFIRV